MTAETATDIFRNHPKTVFGTAAVMSALIIDQLTIPITWRGHKEQTVHITHAPDSAPDTLVIAFPGLGLDHGGDIARAIQPIFEHQAIAAAEYQKNNISQKRLAQNITAVNSSIDGIELNTLWGQSMGGKVAVSLARGLGVPTNVILECTPFDHADVKINPTLLSAANRLPINGGLPAKIIAMAAKELYEKQLNGENHMPKGMLEIVKLAIHGPSPELIRRQFNLINDPVEATPNIENVTYIMPKDPLADPVVDTVQAAKKFLEVFPQLQVVQIDGSEHASVVRHSERYATAIRQQIGHQTLLAA